MEFNLKLSKWASRNIVLSVGLIILFQFLQIVLGVKMGREFLQSISTYELGIVCLLLFSLVFTLQKRFGVVYKHLPKIQQYVPLLRYNSIIFLCTFMLSIALGGHLNTLENPSRSIQLSATEHSTKLDSTLNAHIQQALEKQKTAVADTSETKKDTGKRILYLLLFLLSLVLTYFIAVMACSLACSGYGVVAILVILLGQGVLGSGVYFFLKMFRKGFIKKWKELDTKEKKKERKRYWLTLLISSLAFWLFILLGNMLG
ncbi:hypothetical protein EGI26_04780 [Lacihabitans sp. CCS-44]|uniref:hypothetical protein n=1 Tax=Lacihabitans sp. CCS-44 TaxID=2487331 RepID=UPI0020CE0DAD|nr:hypothetical protein [Lacihabitans sp. CCS-44]MCP9754477.1 hypothetical protein [Lacihabitans sp. CCS-44]